MEAGRTALPRAQAAISRGDFAAAREILTQFLDSGGRSVTAEHTLAVVERRLGNLSAAHHHFEAVLATGADDAEVHNNFANCLLAEGKLEAAVTHYRRALLSKPDWTAVLANLGIVLKQLGRLEAAQEILQRAVALEPDCGRAWHALGMTLWALRRMEDAEAALERALQLAPGDKVPALARAQLEAERGRLTLPRYRRLHELHPSDPEICLGYAVAQFEANEIGGALRTLEELTSSRPDWVKGHVCLAQLRWQAGDSSGFTASFESAWQQHPDDVELSVAYFGTLMRAGRYGAVLERLPRARAAIDAIDLFDRYEAVCASEAGDLERAERAFMRQAKSLDQGLQIARMRHLLRTQRPREAADLGLRLVNFGDVPEAWPYLGLAWRLLGDSRSEWLDWSDSFVLTVDCPEWLPQLTSLSALLRCIHHGTRQPFDQSPRGGTQSDGHLFLRAEPLLDALRRQVEDGARELLKRLPARDPRHPFLRHRDARLECAAAYSIWLRAGGFHVNHVHPRACISACFYVDVPSSTGPDSSDPAGWLALGAPPVELGLNLGPLALIKPVPGRLVLFPSCMWHGSRPFPSGERLTVVTDFRATP